MMTPNMAVRRFLFAGSMMVACSTTFASRAEGQREFQQVGSVSDIRQARGSVQSHKVLSNDPAENTFYVSGEWVLNCGARCETAQPSRIIFDLAHSMTPVNEAMPTHAHQYSNFRADSVRVTQDTAEGVTDNSKLAIFGTITLHLTGRNETVGITLELFRPTTTGIFRFTLTGTNHIESTISGVIVESMR